MCPVTREIKESSLTQGITAMYIIAMVVNLSTVATDRPDVAFVVVGDGPLGDETRARGASIPAIHFAGWRRGIAPVLAALDIMVLCSDNEGIPLSLIEASASGVPIVATRVGSVNDVVTDGVNGILVEPTVDSLAAGIEKLLGDAQLRDGLGAAGKKIATISNGLGGICPVVRVMPNTPTLVGKGAAGYSLGEGVNEHQKKFVVDLLSSANFKEVVITFKYFSASHAVSNNSKLNA